MLKLDNDLVPLVSHSLTHLADREIVRQLHRRYCATYLLCNAVNEGCKVAASAVDLSTAWSQCSAVRLLVWESASSVYLIHDAVTYYEGLIMSHIL